MKGVYISYNEDSIFCCDEHKLNNGSIDEPIRISNDEFLIFEHKFPCTQPLNFPTKMLIRVSTKGDFYLGNLLLVGEYTDFSTKLFENPKHRPMRWIVQDKYHKGEANSVFFISNLKYIEEPVDITKKYPHPPQGIYYPEFD